MINRGTGTSEIGTLSALLKQVQLGLDGEEIADLLWLATQMGEVEVTSALEKPIVESPTDNTTIQPEETTEPSPLPDPIKPEFEEPAASAYLPNPPENQSQSQRKPDDTPTPSQTNQNPAPTGLPFKVPTAPGLRKPLDLARALRPLMRKVPSQTKKILDEEETVTQFAENRILIPVLKPAPERWFDLALVIEKSRSIIIWQEIIAEFQKLTELQGAFRSVSIWSLQTDATGEIQLFKQQNLSSTNPSQQKSRSPKELLDPAGRRLILLVSDCTSQRWHQGKIHEILKLWSSASPLAILQLFPERLWTRTAMGYGFPVQLNAFAPGVPNPKLTIEGLPIWEDVDVAKSITLPVVTLEPDSLKQWSRVVAGVGSTQTAGIVFDPDLIPTQPQKSRGIVEKKLTPEELVNRFQATASPTARRLAGLMATVPVSLPVVHLIQETLLQDSIQVHVAEVFMSGLLEPIENHQVDADIDKNQNPTNNQIPKSEILSYEFVEGVRDLLIDTVRTPDAETVLETVSQYIARKAGISIKNFAALLSPHSDWDEKTQQQILPFAKISNQVLRRLGGEYAALAEQLAPKVVETPVSGQVQTSTNLLENFPPLETYDFEIANIVVNDGEGDEESNIAAAMGISLEPFEYDVAIINPDAKPDETAQQELEPDITSAVPGETPVSPSLREKTASRYNSFDIFMKDVIECANQRADLEKLFDLDRNDVIKIISLLLSRGWWVFAAVATLLILSPLAFAGAILAFMTSPPGLIVATIFGATAVATVRKLYQNKELPIAVKEVGEEFKRRWARIKGNETQVDILLQEAVTSLINKARNM